MLEIGKHTIHLWMADFDLFYDDFEKFVAAYAAEINVVATLNKQKLETVHTMWATDCEHFRVFQFEKEAKELSHIKLMGLLVACMAHSNVFDKIETSMDCEDTDQARREQADLMGAPEAVICFDFALSIIEWFEKYRDDNKARYEFRLIPSVRHDMIRFIRMPDPNKADKTSIILLFDALYSRA